jgi:Uma2 family endonuclease
MATVSTKSPPTPGVVLHGVPWADYETMLRIIGNRPIRINYDRGEMEIVSPLQRHGNESFLLGWMVGVLVEELDVPCEPADPVTYRRPDLEKGVEPDKGFHFRDHAAWVRGKRDLDLTVDPPPDLVVESDLTSSSVPRLPIFAALGIPEVWRLDDDELHFLHLQPDGTYQPRDRSLAFPDLLLADAARFLEQGRDVDKTSWIRAFRAWVREAVVPRPGDAP